MSDRQVPNNRHYEGPPELLQEAVWESNIFDRRGMPGGLSVADRMTRDYGEEGTGWGVDRERYADQNELKNVLHEPEFRLASEAFRNALWSGKYELNDGTDMRGKVQRYVRDPDTVDVLLYPDGKIYQANKK